MGDKSKLKLLLLPYAGGSALFYAHWEKYLKENIEIIPIEFPGRGLRFKEKPCDKISDLIVSIWDTVEREIKNQRYVIFGYCVGTIVLYELFRLIRKNELTEPEHCFICAYSPPNLIKNVVDEKNMSEEELLLEWCTKSQISRELLEEKSYLKILYDIWKLDRKMVNNYIFKGDIELFNCNITLISGDEDFASCQKDIECWKDFTRGSVENVVVRGAHDFLKTNERSVVKIINKTLEKI
ncbi:thioesterase [Fusobacterium necrophorum]|uniref:thioesterase II family protein n=1 Tax=Fusobacterium necrophorum TaxID=859 RepID=UPI0008857EA3|nr:thioesterase domain-containing protein [Fusobacterium necrophorum]AYZ74220.1 thioesterase [Fusobacterium necrophorum]AZW09898.1 thioesterase [Fusobacterium necrophorum subsp. necrophorum]SDB02459.1 Surfactin synthase thioesterase subunit [Fusobacterium necrophorum]SQD08629.1 Linear gramicidin dehydrogenase LgrE [Fusobacterium necrophorum subsp. necrophorum]